MAPLLAAADDFTGLTPRNWCHRVSFEWVIERTFDNSIRFSQHILISIQFLVE
jgi:hypothetical protein